MNDMSIVVHACADCPYAHIALSVDGAIVFTAALTPETWRRIFSEVAQIEVKHHVRN